MDATQAKDRIAAYGEPSYLLHASLTQLVEAYAFAYPHLCRAQSLGLSPEGREIWALTITGSEGGGPEKKPAILIEGNIHAGEVTASAAALYIVKTLLEGYGQSAEITALLDRITFYVLPRVAVDGADFYLSTPHVLRSSPLNYPEPLPPTRGLQAEDIDGDGVIRLMRKQDPLGAWKVSEIEPRIMVKRQPENWQGPFYHLYSEGVLLTEEGRPLQAVRISKNNRGLDFNRNFPAHWSPEAKQPGAGRYPLDQVETRAVADFMLAHTNVNLYLALHTSGGVLLRPPSVAGDESMSPSDLRLFEALGNLCRRSTGYPCKSSHFAFFHTPGQSMTKGSKDWAYEHLGLVAYTMELWDLDVRAGARAYRDIGQKGIMKLSDAEREQDELKKLQWLDKELDGIGFMPWSPFDHPQLGEVEIGGWDEKRVRQNCPLKFLKAECERVAGFAQKLGFTLPKLAIGTLRSKQMPGGSWQVEAEVQNLGFLPTNTTKMALDMKATGPVKAMLHLPEGATLLAGRRIRELGQIEGYSSAADPAFYGAPGPVNSTAWAEWLLDAPAGTDITLTVSHPRAGEVSRALRLGSQ